MPESSFWRAGASQTWLQLGNFPLCGASSNSACVGITHFLLERESARISGAATRFPEQFWHGDGLSLENSAQLLYMGDCREKIALRINRRPLPSPVLDVVS